MRPIPQTPFVSIIVPAFNAAKTISKSIKSILAQDYKNWECIVVDDCSSDTTASEITIFLEDPRICLLTTPRQSGPAVARNIGLKAAKGRLIAFLDSDDLWLPEKLSIQIEFMRSSGSNITYTAYRKFDDSGTISHKSISVPLVATYDSLLKSNCIACLTAMIDRAAFPNISFPAVRRREDYCLWLSLLRKDNSVKGNIAVARGLNTPLALYRIGHESLSKNKLKASIYQWSIYRVVERLSVWSAIYYFIHYAWHGFVKSRIRPTS